MDSGRRFIVIIFFHAERTTCGTGATAAMRQHLRALPYSPGPDAGRYASALQLVSLRKRHLSSFPAAGVGNTDIGIVSPAKLLYL